MSTAYVDEVNDRLTSFLTEQGFEVLSLEAFRTVKFGDATLKTEQEIFDLSVKAHYEAPEADGILICCGGVAYPRNHSIG